MAAFDVYRKLGAERIAAGDVAGAVKPLRVAHRLEPDDVDVRRVLGQALYVLGEQARLAVQPEQARDLFAEAVAVADDNAAAWNGLGQCHVEIGTVAEGTACYRKALELQPDAALVFNNLANALVRLLDYDGAEAAYRRALELAPDDAEIRHNYAMHLLRTGRLAEGWPLHRARLDRPGRMPPVGGPLWDGSDLAGKTVAIWSEQGIGDELMFGTCVPELVARAGRVIWEVSPKLARLCQRSLPGATVIARAPGVDGAATTVERFPWRASAGRIDAWTGSGLLPGFLRPTREAFAGSGGYLTADPVRREAATRWLAQFPRPWVGMCWRGGVVTTRRSLVYASPEALAAVAAEAGVTPVLLQYGAAPEELAAFERAGIPIAAMPGLDLFDDLDGVAGLIAALDLVVSAATSVVELAGALGVPVWRFGPRSDWTLLGEGVDAGYGSCRRPWFESMRAFTKPDADSDWSPVFSEIGAELRMVSSPAH